jgi:hypothetical protein
VLKYNLEIKMALLLDNWLICKQEILNEEPLSCDLGMLNIFAQCGLIVPTDRFCTAVESITEHGMTGYEADMAVFLAEFE